MVAFLFSRNEWYGRHARRVLQERAQDNRLDPKTKSSMREFLGLDSKKTRVLRAPGAHDSTSEAGQLRAMWALQAIGGLDETDKRILLRHKSEWVRAWAIQLGLEDKQITTSMSEELSRLARAISR